MLHSEYLFFQNCFLFPISVKAKSFDFFIYKEVLKGDLIKIRSKYVINCVMYSYNQLFTTTQNRYDSDKIFPPYV